jgi:hypothetical protein
MEDLLSSFVFFIDNNIYIKNNTMPRKVIRLQESDLMNLVKRVMKEQQQQTVDQAQANLASAKQDVRTARGERRDARKDLRVANRASAQAQQNEVNAIYDILKIRRQIGNLPKTIRDSVARYQNTQAFQPYNDSINAALAPIEALLNATANVTPPAQPGQGEETVA